MHAVRTVTGFREQSPKQVREQLTVSDGVLTSLANGMSYRCGELWIPSLAELQETAQKKSAAPGNLAVREIVGDVRALHMDPQNAGALFQGASQFNLLEMTSPRVTPEAGVDIYENDPTQGPACAITCGAGTIYRNYFADLNGQTGQTADQQIDCLADLGEALGNKDSRLWTMKNEYALPTKQGLNEISASLLSCNEIRKQQLRSRLRVGIMQATQVTLEGKVHTISQVYCSALPVAYASHAKVIKVFETSSKATATIIRFMIFSDILTCRFGAPYTIPRVPGNDRFLSFVYTASRGAGPLDRNPRSAYLFQHEYAA